MKPLEGIKVLDLTRVLAGPTCTMILGDLGADIIKIENPEKGDETREWGPPFQNNMSAYFLCANRNKNSMTLNLKHPTSREIIYRLTKTADVVVLNFPKGHLEKLSLQYCDFVKMKPDIIWANITGFGLTGPRSNEPGYDIMIQGFSGLMSITGETDGEPMKVGFAIADVVTALYTAIAIVSAIYRKEKTGMGAMIDNSLLECTTASLVNVASSYLLSKKIPQRFGNAHPSIVPYEVFLAEDTYFILAVGNDTQWKKFCNIIHRHDLAEAEEFSSNQKRVENRINLIEVISPILKQKKAACWISAFTNDGIPAGPVNTLRETLQDPQMEYRGIKQTISHKAYGTLDILKNPIHLDDTPLDIRKPPPTLGEDTNQILTDLGFSEMEIKKLYIDEVI